MGVRMRIRCRVCIHIRIIMSGRDIDRRIMCSRFRDITGTRLIVSLIGSARAQLIANTRVIIVNRIGICDVASRSTILVLVMHRITDMHNPTTISLFATII